MIVRIVTMSFNEEDIPPFLNIFNEYKSQIRASEGCTYLSLIQSTNSPNEISTLSHWKDETYLNNYRNSPVFKQVWPQTKLLFSSPPTAHSHHILTISDEF